MNATSLTPLESQLPGLINDLGNPNGLIRQQARLKLIRLGRESIPALLEALRSPKVNTRWEAARALGELRDPRISPALTPLLTDQDAGVRWTAAESLIWQGRSALCPLLESFINNFDSPWLREATRHILHVFKDRHMLDEEEMALFAELNKPGFFGYATVWTNNAPWAAERALEVLDHERASAGSFGCGS